VILGRSQQISPEKSLVSSPLLCLLINVSNYCQCEHKFRILIIKPTRRTKLSNLFRNETLHAGSGWILILLESLLQTCTTYSIAVCTVKKTADDGQRNFPKHVEFHFQNKFEKISASSWVYYKELCHDARSRERKTNLESCTFSCYLLHVSAVFVHNKVDFTTKYVENNTEVQVPPSQLIY
jgi:hypothetical protein